MNPGDLKKAFEPYFAEMEICRNGKAYWALLHVTVCLPDICAALESANGEAAGKLYIAWCDKYLPKPILSAKERYSMRCTILHQGRSSLPQPGRYTRFVFGQPSPGGDIDHNRIQGTVLHLDVGELAIEMKNGVEKWLIQIEGNPKSAISKNVDNNLQSLVRVTQENIVPTGQPTTSKLLIHSTYKTSSS